MTESTAHERAPGVYAQRQDRHAGSDHSMSGVMSPLFDELIGQTWTEMEQARDRYNEDAKRLRHWRWWFVGMFTFYTTLVGILLLNLIAGR